MIFFPFVNKLGYKIPSAQKYCDNFSSINTFWNTDIFIFKSYTNKHLDWKTWLSSYMSWPIWSLEIINWPIAWMGIDLVWVETGHQSVINQTMLESHKLYQRLIIIMIMHRTSKLFRSESSCLRSWISLLGLWWWCLPIYILNQCFIRSLFSKWMNSSLAQYTND